MNKKERYYKNSFSLGLLFAFVWVNLILGCSSVETVNTSNQSPSANSQSTVSNSQPVANISATPIQSADGKITKQELGAEYPFTVDKGVLGCEGKRGIGLVTFTANGKTYAVNGLAIGIKKYPPIDSIWADDPSAPGKKIVITPVLQRGMQLCK